jgi:hypothetical protein
VLWTHEGCLDGACAALIARKAWPAVEVHYVEPARVDQAMLQTFAPGERGRMTLVDIAPSPAALEAVGEGVEVEVIDHHETAQRLRGRPGVLVDDRRCGSYLRVDDRDRWVRADPISDELSLLYDTLGRTWFHVRFSRPPDEVPPWTAEEKAILANLRDRTNRRRTKTLERAVEVVDPDGRRVRAAVISGDASDTGHLLAEGYDYALMLNPGTGAVSLRGTGKVNLAALAERYGGGGHPNAAGFVPRRLAEHYVRLFDAILGDVAADGSSPTAAAAAGGTDGDGQSGAAGVDR